MKKIKLFLLIGGVLAMTTSCASIMDQMKVDCEDDRTSTQECESFEFNCDSIGE